jgi:hypothetical protein
MLVGRQPIHCKLEPYLNSELCAIAEVYSLKDARARLPTDLVRVTTIRKACYSCVGYARTLHEPDALQFRKGGQLLDAPVGETATTR